MFITPTLAFNIQPV